MEGSITQVHGTEGIGYWSNLVFRVQPVVNLTRIMLLWRKAVELLAQTGVVASVAYTIDGQYIAVLAGWGGAYALAVDGQAIRDLAPVRNASRLLVFKLGADANLPSEPSLAELPLDPPPSRASSEIIQLGGKYARYCRVCHAPGAVGSTVLPDLRRSGTLSNPASWQEVVRGGMLSTRVWQASRQPERK